jgi:hypothetical protein
MPHLDSSGKNEKTEKCMRIMAQPNAPGASTTKEPVIISYDKSACIVSLFAS